MLRPIIEMPSLPEGSGVTEHQGVMIHGAPYRIIMDGLDCYIYELASDQKTMKLLCQMVGPEQTERLGIALLRAATLQREAHSLLMNKSH